MRTQAPVPQREPPADLPKSLRLDIPSVQTKVDPNAGDRGGLSHASLLSAQTGLFRELLLACDAIVNKVFLPHTVGYMAQDPLRRHRETLRTSSAGRPGYECRALHQRREIYLTCGHISGWVVAIVEAL